MEIIDSDSSLIKAIEFLEKEVRPRKLFIKPKKIVIRYNMLSELLKLIGGEIGENNEIKLRRRIGE